MKKGVAEKGLVESFKVISQTKDLFNLAQKNPQLVFMVQECTKYTIPIFKRCMSKETILFSQTSHVIEKGDFSEFNL